MNLQIRDPRARKLARKLADANHSSMTEAVVAALEAEVARLDKQRPLKDRVRDIADALAAAGQGRGRDLTKDEIDDMWTDC